MKSSESVGLLSCQPEPAALFLVAEPYASMDHHALELRQPAIVAGGRAEEPSQESHRAEYTLVGTWHLQHSSYSQTLAVEIRLWGLIVSARAKHDGPGLVNRPSRSTSLRYNPALIRCHVLCR